MAENKLISLDQYTHPAGQAGLLVVQFVQVVNPRGGYAGRNLTACRPSASGRGCCAPGALHVPDADACPLHPLANPPEHPELYRGRLARMAVGPLTFALVSFCGEIALPSR
jgi:hypothetical protein